MLIQSGNESTLHFGMLAYIGSIPSKAVEVEIMKKTQMRYLEDKTGSFGDIVNIQAIREE